LRQLTNILNTSEPEIGLIGWTEGDPDDEEKNIDHMKR